MGGVCHTPWSDTPPWADTPLGRSPPGRHPSRADTPPPRANTPRKMPPLPSASWDTHPPPPLASACWDTDPTGMHSCWLTNFCCRQSTKMWPVKCLMTDAYEVWPCSPLGFIQNKNHRQITFKCHDLSSLSQFTPFNFWYLHQHVWLKIRPNSQYSDLILRDKIYHGDSLIVSWFRFTLKPIDTIYIIIS